MSNINASFVANQVTLNTVSTPVQVLTPNPERQFIQIQNKSSQDVYVYFGTAAGFNESDSLLLQAGAFYEPINSVPVNAITLSIPAIGESIATDVLVLSSPQTSSTDL